jgi:nickel-dependent lactate racemase
MPEINFPYGKKTLTCAIPDERFNGSLESQINRHQPSCSAEALVERAVAKPIGTPRLRVMAENKNNVVIIASDHTRPVPSKFIIPPMLAEIREGNPDAKITILVATGCHRETTMEELTAKFGTEIVRTENIVIHDCDKSETAYLGKLPSDGQLYVNKLAAEADLLVAEGFIEPHFFAGFSGGRKSVLPGIANRKTVMYNHNAEFINSPYARAGVIDGNPIHTDMLYAARAARLAFICNVIINSRHEIVHAVAGDMDLAHREGARFLLAKCRTDAVPSDIVVTTNGGYPLDQNIYQAVKGMTSAEATVKKGGVIVMLAESRDGHGSEEFFNAFVREKNLTRMTETFLSTPKDETTPDQWESQILARVLLHAHVIYVSDAPDDMVSEFQMIPAHSVEETIKKAEKILGNPDAAITVIPDGVSVVVRNV